MNYKHFCIQPWSEGRQKFEIFFSEPPLLSHDNIHIIVVEGMWVTAPYLI